jgi:hypothetical protein
MSQLARRMGKKWGNGGLDGRVRKGAPAAFYRCGPRHLLGNCVL